MDELDKLDDATAATAFRSLVRHLRRRTDAQNIDLMGLSGFCRNCLADWIVEADPAIDREEARRIIYDMPFSEWKAKYQAEATPEQIARMEQSIARNETIDEELDEALDESFPASDPPAMTQPGG
ncbi:DUF1244 domain-containing protein [Sphingomonas sp. HITSZ_GF]|uniref:DUF1244 domain-containing protein n=1 Tax=Sphingomonas sp. HITSZ_GF TaxID=3037247 RepID=UPI00240E015C|nr:DUF1244 domain-containing protein [Sphingomonas sp. HITSZ_GF]MDG2534630.1 DUF1244 domain-containing protein [Sphingomonas sp. HITSZ_GF]